MRPILALAPLSLLASACTQGCAIAKGLYVAVVHNSGAPSRAELARIDARQAEMLRELARRRVVVLPVAVLGRPTRADAATAEAIARRLRAGGLALTTADGAGPSLPFEPQANEVAIFWARFHALAHEVAARPRRDADYVLLVDVFGAPERGAVGAVHAMAVTGAGDMAYHGFWNSSKPLYKELAPRSLDDVAAMVATDLSRRAVGAHPMPGGEARVR